MNLLNISCRHQQYSVLFGTKNPVLVQYQSSTRVYPSTVLSRHIDKAYFKILCQLI
jgi:hypothetical protein